MLAGWRVSQAGCYLVSTSGDLLSVYMLLAGLLFVIVPLGFCLVLGESFVNARGSHGLQDEAIHLHISTQCGGNIHLEKMLPGVKSL